MRPCSAACTVPSTRPGAMPAAFQRLGRHRVPAGPRDERPLGEVEIARPRSRGSSRSACAGTRSRGCVTSTAPRCTTASPTGACCSSATIAMSVSVRGMRVLVVVVGLEHGDVVAEVESRRRGTADPGAGRPRPGARRANTRASSTVPIVRSVVDVDELVLDRRPAAQPDAGRGRARARPVHVPAARREQVGLHELAHRVVEPVAEPAARRRVRAAARGPRTRPARGARTGSAGSRPRARARVPVSSAGCATYHWSSWSSPATSTAAARRSVRPGAPRLLPHRRERAGEAVEHDRVEAADVDAELERVRGRDAEQPAARELELELAALRREVAGAVRGDARAEPGLELLEPRRVRVARRARRRGGCA